MPFQLSPWCVWDAPVGVAASRAGRLVVDARRLRRRDGLRSQSGRVAHLDVTDIDVSNPSLVRESPRPAFLPPAVFRSGLDCAGADMAYGPDELLAAWPA